MQKKIQNPKWFSVPFTRRQVMQIGGDAALFNHWKKTGDVSIIKDNALDALVICGEEIPANNSPAEWERVVKSDGNIVFINSDENEAEQNAKHLWPDMVVAKKRYGLLVMSKNKQLAEKPKPKNSCLVIRYGAWGDQIICAGVFPLLKEQGHHITLNCQTPQDIINATNPHVDEMMVQDRDQVDNDDLLEYWNAIATEYDKVINLSESIEGELLLSSDSAKFFWPQSARHKLFNANYMERTHDVAGVKHNFSRSLFYATSDEKAKAEEIRQRFDAPLICWAVAGSAVHKWYPHMGKVLAKLLAETDAYIMLMGDDEAIPLQDSAIAEAQEIYGDVSRIAAQCGTLPMRGSMAIADTADVVVGPETGLLNAVGRSKNHKVVLLSHSGKDQLTKHWINAKEILPEKAPCFPCHRLHFSFEHCSKDEQTGASICNAVIEPETIFKAIKNGLHKSSSK